MARNTIDQDINIIAHADNTIVKTINPQHATENNSILQTFKKKYSIIQ
jgi:predicted metal-dependent phosphoesterase TrpH